MERLQVGVAYLGRYLGTYLPSLHRLLGLVLAAKEVGQSDPIHENVSPGQADRQWYMERDAKPASCGTTLGAPAPAGIFFLETGTWPALVMLLYLISGYRVDCMAVVPCLTPTSTHKLNALHDSIIVACQAEACAALPTSR